MEDLSIPNALPILIFSCKTTQDMSFISVSEGSKQVTGYASSLLSHLSLSDLIIPACRSAAKEKRTTAFTHQKVATLNYIIETADGEKREILEVSTAKTDDEMVGILLKASLPSTSHSREYLENRMLYDSIRARSAHRALLLVQLQALPFCLRYNHLLTDQITHKLQTVCPIMCTINEHLYALYLDSYDDHSHVIEFCTLVSDILKAQLFDEGISWGIGIVGLKQNEEFSVQGAFRNALAASEHALASPVHYSLFTTEMANRLSREEHIVRKLNSILTEKQESLSVVYQPILNCKTNTIDSFEVLARLHDAQLGIVSPVEFIPLAEKTKYIIPLGRMILIQAFQFLGTLRQAGYPDITLSVNVSVIQLLDPTFLSDVLELLKTYSVDPTRVCLEVTESVLVSNYPRLNTLLAKFQQQGICLALDDFGTGYSSLAHIRKLHIDILKIDKLFIDGLNIFPEHKTITGDIIAMVHKLGYTIVAEGVEHETQYSYLLKHNCDKIQGFLVSKPLSAEAALKLLSQPALCKGIPTTTLSALSCTV